MKKKEISRFIKCPACGDIRDAHYHCKKCHYPVYIKLDENREMNRKEEVETLKKSLEECKEIIKQYTELKRKDGELIDFIPKKHIEAIEKETKMRYEHVKQEYEAVKRLMEEYLK